MKRHEFFSGLSWTTRDGVHEPSCCCQKCITAKQAYQQALREAQARWDKAGIK